MDKHPSSAVWDRTWQSSGYGIDAMTRIIAGELFKIVPVAGRSILELGCGSGRLSYLARGAGAQHVTMVDFSEAALRQAKARFAGQSGIEFIKADLLSLVLPRKYDVVFSSGVVEHFRGDQLDQCIRAHVRHSRHLVAIAVPTTPHLNSLRCRLPWVVQKYGWQRPMRVRPLKQILERHGAVMRAARRFYPLYGIPFLGSSEPLVKATRFLDRWLGGFLLVVSQTTGE